MNILLIQPNFNKNEKVYPLGLAYIASMLKKENIEVKGADLSFLTFTDVLSIINKNNIKVVGVSLASFNLNIAIKFCSYVKRHTGVIIVAGGSQATADGVRLIQEHKTIFDYMIFGDGETAFPKLVKALKEKTDLASVPNLIYFKAGNLNINSGFKEDLDRLPFPDRDIFPLFKYDGVFVLKKNYTQMITSRGCDRLCRYCPEPFINGKWRGRLPIEVVREIEIIVKEYGIQEIHFEDSNILGGGCARLNEICALIIKKGLRIAWRCPNGIPVEDLKDYNILYSMAKAGCYEICLGIETFDKNILSHYKRCSDYGHVKRIIETARKAGIKVCGYFIIGFPGQDEKSIKKDIALSHKLDLDFVYYSIYEDIPGAEACKCGFGKSYNLPILSKRLKKIRSAASVWYLLRPKVLFYCLKKLINIKYPLNLITKTFVYIFNK